MKGNELKRGLLFGVRGILWKGGPHLFQALGNVTLEIVNVNAFAFYHG
jgi:hypothetical protein